MIRALLVIVACTAIASADPEADADAAFRAAGALAAKSDPAAITAFEALGEARPITRWTDDAWAEAARLSENARDYARARRDYRQVVALGTDPRLVARAKGALARIEELGGERWDAVRATHERLASVINGGDDPHDALQALADLVRANPQYPRANLARLTIAMGWEAEGESTSALAWYREGAESAAAEPGQHVRLEYVRALVRAGELDDAERALAALDPALVDQGGARQAAETLATAHRRRAIRYAIAIVIVLLVAGGVIVARREAGGWPAVGKIFARPSTEAWFLAPLAILLALVALPGNPLVARAVRWIGVAGVGTAWLSGALLEAARTRGPLRARRMIVHVVLVIGVVGAAAYLVVDGIGLLGLLEETWRGGPALE